VKNLRRVGALATEDLTASRSKTPRHRKRLLFGGGFDPSARGEAGGSVGHGDTVSTLERTKPKRATTCGEATVSRGTDSTEGARL
jgi:hypothetical protein